jgi:hypothetical protein
MEGVIIGGVATIVWISYALSRSGVRFPSPSVSDDEIREMFGMDR